MISGPLGVSSPFCHLAFLPTLPTGRFAVRWIQGRGLPQAARALAHSLPALGLPSVWGPEPQSGLLCPAVGVQSQCLVSSSPGSVPRARGRAPGGSAERCSLGGRQFLGSSTRLCGSGDRGPQMLAWLCPKPQAELHFPAPQSPHFCSVCNCGTVQDRAQPQVWCPCRDVWLPGTTTSMSVMTGTGGPSTGHPWPPWT